jgi:hypothetical protein
LTKDFCSEQDGSLTGDRANEYEEEEMDPRVFEKTEPLGLRTELDVENEEARGV